MFEAVIGMEIHVELKSKNKVFSNVINSFSNNPNEFVNPIDLAFPGTLPKLNFEVVEMSLKAALALNCKINKEMHFDRKNYFYPDLPKGYQITQNKTPIGYDGFIEIEVDGVLKRIGIERLHIEEDTCKSIHDEGTKLNYNRAGVPLIEIVTKPDIKTSKEAVLYLEKIREILAYLGVSDVKMEEGSMRCEANVSIREKGSSIFGTKVEVKNIGSITNAGLAIDYEIKRQEEVVTSGHSVVHETRKFDESKKETVLMRVKESGNDYRYFPEPDLPFLILESDYIESVRANLPLLPDQLREKYKNLGLNDNYIKTIVGNLELYSFFEDSIKTNDPVICANILTSFVLSEMNKTKKDVLSLISLADFSVIASGRFKEEISSSQVKDIFTRYFSGEDLSLILESLKDSLMPISTLQGLIGEVISENESSVNDHKAGSDRAIKFLMGQLMKKTKGKADPKTANEELLKALDDLH